MGDVRDFSIPDNLAGIFSDKLSKREALESIEGAGLGLDDLLVGSIEWDVSVGNLLTEPMADAFTVEAVFREYVGVDSEQKKEVYLPNYRYPGLFDGKDEGDRRRVHFVASNCPNHYKYFVKVGFSPKAKWQKPNKFSLVWARKIVPPAPMPFIKTEWVMEPFEVLPKWWW